MKIPWEQSRAGSSPAPGTTSISKNETMDDKKGTAYRDAGVLTAQELRLEATLLKWVRATENFRQHKQTGRSALGIGYFANVIDLGGGQGLAITADGVGTKVLVAEMLGRYDTIGIDCVAMNVNDVLCVGAEPLSMVDYIGIEKATPEVLEAIGRGLHEGAKQAGINIVGGEISQMSEIIHGAKGGEGLDLVGMCVGLVAIDAVNQGQDVAPGDIIIGLRSSGIHSNGLTLARKVLFEAGHFKPDSYLPELGRTVGEELLEPTHIYVPEVMELLKRVPIKALINVTSEGFLNLTRIRPAVGFRMENLPDPQPIFKLIQKVGNIPDREMYHVFNMGIGFCLIVPNDREILDTVHKTATDHGVESFGIGEVVEDENRRVLIPEKNLVGQGDRFMEMPDGLC